jgi:alpha-L-rhamnosidase
VAWVYQVLAGIDTTSTGPGFHEITIQPHPNAQMTSARAQYESAYGRIVVDWSNTQDGKFTLQCTIPANSTARVVIPAGTGAHVVENGKAVHVKEVNGERFVEVGSGTYSFSVH